MKKIVHAFVLAIAAVGHWHWIGNVADAIVLAETSMKVKAGTFLQEGWK